MLVSEANTIQDGLKHPWRQDALTSKSRLVCYLGSLGYHSHLVEDLTVSLGYMSYAFIVFLFFCQSCFYGG